MHEPLMIAPERLVLPCVLDCCSPSSLVDEVYVLVMLLLLQVLIESLDSWRAHGDLQGKACFGPVDQEERGFPSCPAGCGPVPPQYARKLINPFCAMFLKIAIGPDLEPSEDLSISPLDLAIAPRMCHGGETELDSNVLAVLLEVLACEMSPIVGTDPVRDPKPAHD
jgi:hypothetical protein